ncbi:MAG: TetR/AcrR family transcriptional regulator [Myxococcales bacterium]|nr:TetR/AcrR family transcriptional regulator [Myxococcales bacterium]
MRAAIELGTELGEEGLTMRGIAARLGVSATALYQHFEGKASILQAIRFHGMTLLNRTLAPAFEAEDPVDQLRQVAIRSIDFARSNPWLYGLLFQGEDIDPEGFTEEQRQSIASSSLAIKDAIRRGKEIGRLRPDVDVETGPLLMWASNHGLSMLLITGRISAKHPSYPIPDEDAFIKAFVEAEIRGLTPCPF